MPTDNHSFFFYALSLQRTPPWLVWFEYLKSFIYTLIYITCQGYETVGVVTLFLATRAGFVATFGSFYEYLGDK